MDGCARELTRYRCYLRQNSTAGDTHGGEGVLPGRTSSLCCRACWVVLPGASRSWGWRALALRVEPLVQASLFCAAPPHPLQAARCQIIMCRRVQARSRIAHASPSIVAHRFAAVACRLQSHSNKQCPSSRRDGNINIRHKAHDSPMRPEASQLACHRPSVSTADGHLPPRRDSARCTWACPGCADESRPRVHVFEGTLARDPTSPSRNARQSGTR